MLNFHVALAAWRDLPKAASLCKSRDEVAWATDDNIKASTSLGGDASIGRWRSHTAECFLQLTAHDVLVFIDHDQAWMAGSIERIVDTCQTTKGVVSAAISKRRHGAGLACRVADGYTIYPDTDHVIPAKSVGAGFLAIHRQALNELRDHTEEVEGFGGVDTFRTYFMEGTGETPHGGKMWLGEDKAFCIRCRAAGIPIHIDCKPRVDHVGEYAFTIEDGLK